MADVDMYTKTTADSAGFLTINGKRFRSYFKAKEYLIKNTWPEFDAQAYINLLLEKLEGASGK